MARLRGWPHRGGEPGDSADRKAHRPGQQRGQQPPERPHQRHGCAGPDRHRRRRLPVSPVRHRRRHQQDPGVWVAGGVHHRGVCGDRGRHRVAGAARRAAEPGPVDRRDGGGGDRVPAGAGTDPEPGQPAGLWPAGHPLPGARGLRGADGRGLRGRGPAPADGQDPGRGHRGRPRRRLAEERGRVRRRCCLAAGFTAAAAGPVHRGRRAGVPGRRPDPAGALPGRGPGSAVGGQAAGGIADADRGPAARRPGRAGRPGAQERRADRAAAGPAGGDPGIAASAWSRRKTTSGAGSSATSTTARSSNWWRWPSSCPSPNR